MPSTAAPTTLGIRKEKAKFKSLMRIVLRSRKAKEVKAVERRVGKPMEMRLVTLTLRIMGTGGEPKRTRKRKKRKVPTIMCSSAKTHSKSKSATTIHSIGCKIILADEI